MRVKFGNGTKDVPITEVTAENYLVPKGEEGSFHVVQEIKTFDQRTGKRLSRPRVQKYGVKEFPSVKRILLQQGYDLTVLYDPTEYLKVKAEEKAEREALTARQQHDRKVAQREQEKAKMKAEIIEELKAAGVIKTEPAEEKKQENKSDKSDKKTK